MTNTHTFKNELYKLILSVAGSLILFVLIAFWRLFDPNSFLFLQILFCSAIFLLFLYSLRSRKFPFKLINGNELLIVSISFILVTFLLLNIDRSRSFFLLKWVESSGSHGTTITELQKHKNLSDSDLVAVKQRVKEQDQSGFIFKENERIYISRQGKILVFIFRNLASFENLKGYLNA